MIESLVYTVADAAVYFGLVLSMWISFRLLRYPDLALEQLFVLGSAIFATVVSLGMSPLLALPALMAVALVLGASASLLRNWLGINAILVSLLAAYFYYSMTLTILGGPNMFLGDLAKHPSPGETTAVAAITFGGLVSGLAVLFGTPLGLRILACGANWQLARRYGLQPLRSQAIGLSAAFMCTLVAGAINTWRMNTVDVGDGDGLLLVAIFSVLVTRGMQRRVRLVPNALMLAAVLLAYLVVLQIAVHIGLPPHWLSGAKAFALLLVIAVLPFDARNELRVAN